MTAELEAGIQLRAVLAGREADETERVLVGRRQAREAAEAERDNAILAAYDQRLKESRRYGI